MRTPELPTSRNAESIAPGHTSCDPIETSINPAQTSKHLNYDRKSAEQTTEPGTANRPSRSLWGRLVHGVRWLVVRFVSGVFGFVSLVFLLSILATIPILQFLSLGYLLEAGGRVARSGRVRDGFIGLPVLRRVAGILVAGYLLLLPLRVLADIRYSAVLLEAGSGQARLLTVVLWLATILWVIHMSWAIFRGGRLRSFIWPAPIKLFRRWRQGGMYVSARDRCWNQVIGMRLPYYFSLGLRGFLLALAWLAVPITILVIGSRLPEGFAVLTGIVGGLMLLTVLLYLPFLQLNFACSRQVADGFRWREVRDQFRRAPLAFWIALAATLVLALPLYLLKAELIPREAAWLPSLVFVLSIFPSRLLAGWAIGRAERRQEPSFFLLRWLARLTALPVVAAYVFIVYLTQYLSWYGVWSLYEQHAFLLPVPFLGM
jgi:hypothetical protein